ncbi:MAG: methyltransferase domain-containing protein [Bacteroidota bacterium]|nr:methyltransferase domain-containing protein [Bacteroidota bacterium]MDP4234604.1 methyltransferase domain-containing protein [Bacteroidota bacterium]MDP4243797.1 methyltransferase domain-containing protein [Bacteroidota bacterium]MDP4288965.1 methyltransferase domain-containing protein [Bacteroidota bacterium]
MDARLAQVLACPNCGGVLDESGDTLRCRDHGCEFKVEHSIPILIERKEPTGNFDYLTHYTLDSEQFDYFEERTGATAHSERRLREYVLSLIPSESKSILDVGCGSAWVAKAFQHSGKFVCSLDVSIVNPKKAIERYPSPDHVAIVADSYRLPFRDGSFDAIVAAEIIEHLHDPKVFAEELMRVVRPGGVVIVSTPFNERLVYEICIHCHQPTPHNAHLHSWTKESLTSLFIDSSIRVDFYTFNNKLLLFGRTYPALRLLPFSAWKAVDGLANTALNKPVNCILRVTR